MEADLLVSKVTLTYLVLGERVHPKTIHDTPIQKLSHVCMLTIVVCTLTYNSQAANLRDLLESY